MSIDHPDRIIFRPAVSVIIRWNFNAALGAVLERLERPDRREICLEIILVVPSRFP